MNTVAECLLQARLDARLDASTVALLAGLDDAQFEEIEAGRRRADPDELDALARVFGVSMRGLVTGKASTSAASRLLFRAAGSSHRLSLEQYATSGAPLVVGEFLRSVTTVRDLAARAGKPITAKLPEALHKPLLLSDRPPYGADELATRLRAELELGLERIPSMRALLENLGVLLFWTTPEELVPEIDGASTGAPAAAVLVNLVQGADCWWRTRMTLAHELCHLLVDHVGPNASAIVSPRVVAANPLRSQRRLGWDLFDGFDLVERRAGAFAACFLAPAEGVRAAVNQRDPTSEAAIRVVGETFGLGRTTAIYRLKHVYRLGEPMRASMEARSPSHWDFVRDHPDAVTEGIGLRAGILPSWVKQALVGGVIDRVEAREILRLPLTESLPFPDVSAELSAPLRRPEDAVRAVAQQHLQRTEGPDAIATEVRLGEDGWLVDVRRAGGGKPSCLRVSYDLEVAGAPFAA